MYDWKWTSVEFYHEISHRGWPITVLVEAQYYQGSTPPMGDDPSQVEILAVTDGTGSDVWDKLPYDDRKTIETIAKEKGADKCFT